MGATLSFTLLFERRPVAYFLGTMHGGAPTMNGCKYIVGTLLGREIKKNQEYGMVVREFLWSLFAVVILESFFKQKPFYNTTF